MHIYANCYWFTNVDSTALLERLFHSSTTRFENKCLLMSSQDHFVPLEALQKCLVFTPLDMHSIHLNKVTRPTISVVF